MSMPERQAVSYNPFWLGTRPRERTCNIDDVHGRPFRYTYPNWRMSMRLLLTLVLAATAFAETHQFTPTKFYNTFSGAHPPVLHIKPGDHVVTSTLDAGSFDSAGVKRGERPNPETGPF